MADAQCSERCELMLVEVQILSSAQELGREILVISSAPYLENDCGSGEIGKHSLPIVI